MKTLIKRLLKENLNEINDYKSLAYHFTGLSNLNDIIKTDSLTGGNTSGISLTRDKDFHTHTDGTIGTQVRLTFDLNKLKHTYKVGPKHATWVTDTQGNQINAPWKGDPRRDTSTVEFEEFVSTNIIKNLHNYLLVISIWNVQFKKIQEYPEIINYCKTYNIKLNSF